MRQTATRVPSETRTHLWWVNQSARALTDGGGTRQFELGRELAGLGWHTTIVASDFDVLARRFLRRRDPGDRTPLFENQDGVTFQWLWSAPYRRNDWRRAWNWASFARSVARGRGAPATPPALIIGSSPPPFAAWAAARLASRLCVPFVFEVRDLWPESLLAAGGRRGPFYYLVDRVVRRLYRTADRTLALADGTADYLARDRAIALSRIVVVSNGVDVAAFDVPRPERPRELVVSYAGAHGPANGLEAVILAAAQLGDLAGLTIELIGDGPSRPALRALATRTGAANVVFRDPIPKSEMPRRLATVDAGLMVLRPAELFSFGVSPNKLFDYLGAGLPVICNVPGEVAHVLRQAGAGLQCADASPAALAATLRTLYAMAPDARRRLGEAGRRWVRTHRDRRVLAAKLDAALRALVPDHG